MKFFVSPCFRAAPIKVPPRGDRTAGDVFTVCSSGMTGGDSNMAAEDSRFIRPKPWASVL